MVERTAFNRVTQNAKSTGRNTPSDLRFQQAALRPRSESARRGTSKRRGVSEDGVLLHTLRVLT